MDKNILEFSESTNQSNNKVTVIELVDVSKPSNGLSDNAGDILIISDNLNPSTILTDPSKALSINYTPVNGMVSINVQDAIDESQSYNLQLISEFTEHADDVAIHYPMSGITITESQITGLLDNLDSKSDTGHTHNYDTINNVPNLTVYQSISGFTEHVDDINIHYHQSGITITESQVTNLIDDLNSKSDTGHTHNYDIITNIPDLSVYQSVSGFTEHVDDVSIHYPQSGITITESQVTGLLNKYSLSGHTHDQYLISSDLNEYATIVETESLINGAVSGLTSSWTEITDKPSWLSGDTMGEFQTSHTHNYDNLDNLPNLFDGNYISLSGTPDLAVYQSVSGFTEHVDDMDIHFTQSGITINENQILNLVGDLANKENIGIAAQLISDLKNGVISDGDTLKKLYNLIVSSYSEVTVETLALRDAYNVTKLPTAVFVLDDGDAKWALYKAITTGTTATYVKLSDPDLLNAVMTATQIQAAYESNTDVNRFSDVIKAKLDSITAIFTSALKTAYDTASDWIVTNGVNILNHISIIAGNPHGTTKSDIGLGSVDDTSDMGKPVSTAQSTAINSKQDALPDQTENVVKYLSNNGTILSWEIVEAGGTPTASVTPFTSQLSVTVSHNFETYPMVEVIDSNGVVLIPMSIIHNNISPLLCTAVTITFSAAVSGFIILTYGAIKGSKGDKGDTGAGMTLFAGGTTGQALIKGSIEDYVYAWGNALAGPLTGDVTTTGSGVSTTLSDSVVSYSKLSQNLVSSLSSNTGIYNFSANGIINATLSATTAITFNNLQLNKSIKMKLTISNGAVITFPAYCIKMSGSQTLGDGIFYLYFDCWNVANGTELVIYSIMKQ